CSVLKDGYAAGPNKPGIAPLRAHTYYEPCDYPPGVPPRVVTTPYADDLKGMLEDIAAVRKEAHIVVLSLHWGVQMIPRLIADYQPVVAQAAFDAGVDLILGHHAHIPKAIGVYKGKVCFYSLSNFIISSPTSKGAYAKQHNISQDPDYPFLAYGVDA